MFHIRPHTSHMIWKVKPTVEQLNAVSVNSMDVHLGIEFTEVGDDYLKARMPVNERTRQPYGLLHGGASCVLAESLGSVAGNLCVEFGKQVVVGVEINANHLRSVREGYVYGTVKPLHVGRSLQVWSIEITNEEGKLVCVSRLTVAVKNL
ncbi:MAG: hotdog fold thioesterase [Chitinophagales bacterium]|nr:hotdog fold thioesterase [Chitinophagales bacterium]MDW8419010.1 hotdog fold thioesterase [Chitinophagales bacterium]